MPEAPYPEWYQTVKERHPGFVEALEQLGHTARMAGPLDAKSAQLVQLAAAVALRSEGAVHSHTRRALAAGASMDEITHAVLLLTSTVGYPNVSAALSWVNDVAPEKEAL